MKYKLKQIWKNTLLYLALPHIWILGIIIIFSIISCMISIVFMEKNPFLSSIFANIFAGFVTGIVISLISSIKSITLYRIECLIEWLDSLHNDILEYIKMHRKIIFRSGNDFDEETFYNHIYDTLCCGNNINVKITQGVYNYSLPFNTYKYIKKHFNYDAINCSKNNQMLRDKIMLLDTKNVTNKELLDLFKDMDYELNVLNGEIIKHITYLKSKKKAINISLL